MIAIGKNLAEKNQEAMRNLAMMYSGQELDNDVEFEGHVGELLFRSTGSFGGRTDTGEKVPHSGIRLREGPEDETPVIQQIRYRREEPGKSVVFTDIVTRTISGQNARVGGSEEVGELLKGAREEGGSVDLCVGAVKKKPIFITGLYLEGVKADIPARITPFDMDVLMAYSSVLDGKKLPVSLNQILEKLNGKEVKSGVNTGIAGAVRESMRKLMLTLIEFDWSQHAEMKGVKKDGKNVKRFKVSSNIVYARHVTIEYPNGTQAEGYLPLAVPDLYTYAKSVGQISTVDDSRIIDIPGIRGTQRNIVIRNFLIRRIEWARHSDSRSPNRIVKIDTLIKNCRLEDEAENRATKQRIGKLVCYILDHYTEIGYITGYEKIWNGKSLQKVRLFVNGEELEKWLEEHGQDKDGPAAN